MQVICSGSKQLDLTYTDAAAVADATLAKAETTAQSPDPTALAAADAVTIAVKAVEFATAAAQAEPAQAFNASAKQRTQQPLECRMTYSHVACV